MRLIMLGCALSAVCVFGLAPSAFAAGACQMVEIGELAVTIHGSRAEIDAQINGKPTQLLIDSGSAGTVLFRSSAQQLGLALKPLDAARLYGVGGGDSVATARIDTFKISTMTAHNFDVIVAGRALGEGGPAGVLGAGFLFQADLEIDYPDSKIRFFKPKDCVGDQVVYWGKAYTVTPILPSNTDEKIEVTVQLNGAPVRAQLDTGASTSIVTTSAAARAGVTPTSNGVTAAGQSSGLGSNLVDTYVGVFPTFTFGDETIRNAKLRIADLFQADKEVALGSHIATQVIEPPQMLLGFDFFRSHRVYIARGQGKIYASYMGGPVFDTKRPARAVPAAAPSSP